MNIKKDNEEYIPLSNADPGMYVSEDNHILQSELWKQFQKALGKKVISIKKNGFSYNAVIENTPIGKYLFVPYGPYLANHYQLKPAIKSLKKQAKKEGAIFVRIEPTICFSKKDMCHSGGGYKSKDIDPAETWILEIPEDKNELMQKLPKRMRGYYNTHEKNKIEIVKDQGPKNIHHLARLQKETFSKKGIRCPDIGYLRNELEQDFSTLYLAKIDDKVIAAVMVFDDEETRYYVHAASDKEYAKMNPNGILTIQAILDAWEKGLVAFDFWGIAPEGAPKDHPWAGFTAFKKMFKGEERIYSGTYDIPVKRIRYQIYRILRKMNRIFLKRKG